MEKKEILKYVSEHWDSLTEEDRLVAFAQLHDIVRNRTERNQALSQVPHTRNRKGKIISLFDSDQ